MKITIYYIILFYSIASNASANWDFSKSHKDKCSDGGQQQMNSCLAREYDEVDKELNNLYTTLKGKMEEYGTDTKPFVKTQKAWIKFRDLECEFSNPPHGGSIYSYAQNACLIDLTKKRINDFKDYLSWRWSGCNGCRW